MASKKDNKTKENKIKEDKVRDENSKEKSLKKALDDIKKDFGEGAIMKLGERTAMNIETISTGSINIDLALGVGGLPRGRVIEVYGTESSGKTTIALHVVAQAQKNGGVVAFIDAEHALDPTYAKALGVDIDELLISQPDYGEQALEIAELLINSGAVNLIVVDSVAALTPKAEIDGKFGDQQMGLQARLMSKALRKLTASLNKSKTTIIFINQIRDKIVTQVGRGSFQTTTTGGKALKFYASIRLEVKRESVIKNGDEIVGNKTAVKVTKNKVAPPFKVVKFEILYGRGIDHKNEILNLALDTDIIGKAGSWYSFEGKNIGQGKASVMEEIEKNRELFEKIEKEVMKKIESGEMISEKTSQSKEESENDVYGDEIIDEYEKEEEREELSA